MLGTCPINAWSKNGKYWFKGKEGVCVGRGRGKCFGCGEEDHYVAQCLKASPRKCFSCGEIGHLSLQCRRGPICFNCRELGYTAVSCPKLRQLNDLVPREEGASWPGGFVIITMVWGSICCVPNGCIPGEKVYQQRE